MIVATAQSSSARRQRRGFSLIELMVAIGIIAVLGALLLTATGVLSGRSEEQSTQSAMDIVAVALDEFEKEAGRKLTYGDPDEMAIAPDLDETTMHVFTSCELTQRLRFSDSAVDVLGKLPQGRTLRYDAQQELPPWAKVGAVDDPDPQVSGQASIADPIRNGEYDGQMTLVDNWERPMRVVHPGRTWRTGDTETRDEDGTIRTPVELIYGICREKRILIVSSGPDQVFGTLSGTEAEQAFAEDNIYSYEPYQP